MVLVKPIGQRYENFIIFAHMKENKRMFWLLMAILIVCTLPWLGVADFYTKGEPREAIVGQTMLDQANWILPHNNGGDIAYKPPFFHWMIAACSLPLGYVTEWTARVPSAIACIIMLLWMYVFYAKRRDSQTAFFATLLTFSTFEVYRAAFACRVDMMLTLGIVGAMFAFMAWTERERRGIPWLAIAMMSLGTLSKGPIAIMLPCGVTGLYLLLRRERLLPIIGWMTLSALLALVVPALWYYFAWQQGGDEFLQLVKEENVDRFLGKMSYRSHENGLWYYFVMLPACALPWVLPVGWMAWKRRKEIGSPKQWLKLSPETLFSIVAFVVIFVFYCIPKSKRSVYLLPLYPFMGWFMAIALRQWSHRVRRWVVGGVLALWVVAMGIVVPLLMKSKSDKDIAQDIERMQLNKPLTSYLENNVPGNMTHLFTINFYLRDGVDYWRGDETEGYILLRQDQAQDFIKRQSHLDFQLVYTSPHKSCDVKRILELYQFSPARSISK